MIGGYGRGWRHRRWYYATGIPGFGRGRCWWDPWWAGRPDVAYPGYVGPELSEEDEVHMLEEEEQALRAELEEISKRLAELKTAKKEKK